MCGLPPFVDEMIDVFIDDDVVVVGVPRLFTRPLRLTAPEGFALVAAGRAAMLLPGADPDGPLGRGLQKLEAALGDDGVVMDAPGNPGLDELVETLADAVFRTERVAVRYWTASRDEITERTITPRQMFIDRGDWYVEADDERSGERRTFRVDRIEHLERTGELAEPEVAGESGEPGRWFAEGGLPQVTLRLQPRARWVVERYPVDEVREQAHGVVRARFPVASETWLDRLLLRLGPHVEVIAPARSKSAAADAAARVLARYADD
jgi:proteasome accessory factor C